MACSIVCIVPHFGFVKTHELVQWLAKLHSVYYLPCVCQERNKGETITSMSRRCGVSWRIQRLWNGCNKCRKRRSFR